MNRDFLSEFGPERHQNPEPPFVDGGILQSRDVMNYVEPTGPINRHNPGPGLRGGTNLGHDDNMGSTGDGAGGSPGLHGSNRGCCGSQGRY